ncbi:MAG: FMN-binding glutamate synthase family protein [Planctomycetota bacterium]
MWIALSVLGVLVLIALYDLFQKKHAILRNFPVIGHFRYLLEAIGPELRQYIVTNNDEERPFSRDERRWVYASSKSENNYFGFGTDNDLERAPNYLIVKPAALPHPLPVPRGADYDPSYTAPCTKILGEARGRARAFRPESVVNISGMSFGSLSGPAIEALNRGSKIAGCLHNTGEGGVSQHHLHGGDLIWQIGTGYFGCRADDGGFSLERLLETVESSPEIRAIEIKLSQGAKPGLGGILPAAKVTPEIAKTRGIPEATDCLSPASHQAFHDVDSLLDLVETIADRTGLPVGVKSAIGEMKFWEELASAMESGERGVDFIAVDGGEGGTGAAPLVFTDHVSLPFRVAMARVYRTFAEHNLHRSVVFVGAGRLGLPQRALAAFALGCDLVNVGRTAMLSVGCIQAQKCHTGHCPTGVATQNPWLVRGLDPTDKAGRVAQYVLTLRKELLQLASTCGESHPALIGPEHLEFLDDRYGAITVAKAFDLDPEWSLFPDADRRRIDSMMADIRKRWSGSAITEPEHASE